MHLSEALRRFVASIIAVLFLACQGMIVAYAVPAGAALSDAAAAPESCHETGRQPGGMSGNEQCKTRCQSQNTSSQSAVHIFTAHDLLATALVVDLPVAIADVALASYLPLLRVEPPPLRILNCCLRN